MYKGHIFFLRFSLCKGAAEQGAGVFIAGIHHYSADICIQSVHGEKLSAQNGGKSLRHSDFAVGAGRFYAHRKILAAVKYIHGITSVKCALIIAEGI